jgi:hypothetical protein
MEFEKVGRVEGTSGDWLGAGAPRKEGLQGYVERICFSDRREANPWRLRTKLPVLYAPENKHRSTCGALDSASAAGFERNLR